MLKAGVNMTEQIELITVLKELHNISGFRISVYDTSFQEISAYPSKLTGFCKYIQENETAKKSCKAYDKKAFEKVKESGQTYIYHCKFGLYEAVSPLYHFGVLSGYLMMGQTLDNQADSVSHVYYCAKDYVKDKERLREEINHIPISSKDKILSCLSIMKVCAAYITLSNGWKLSDKELSSKVKQYLNQHYDSKITLDLLCNEFYCSKSTLTNCFKKSFGRSINDYLTSLRLEQAKILLCHGSLTINKISQACGFSDQNYFSKVFFKTFGQTPSQYSREKQDN